MIEKLKDHRIIVSVSGGKDSTAICLNLFEKGYLKKDFDRIFFDTGWESPITYNYLDKLEKYIGPIKRLKAKIKVLPEHKKYIEYFENKLGFESPFIRRSFLYTGFPTRLRKWCTSDLKIKPALNYFNSLNYNFINVIGIRAEESAKRSKLSEWEFNDNFDCYVWRPLINWTEKNVIDIHHRFNLIPNSLYLNGSNRVGCYPCINSRKQEIKNINTDRIDLIRELEEILTKLKRERKGLNVPEVNFFQSVYKNKLATNINEVYMWSQTQRGGVQFELFASNEPTCVKWGMCDFR